MSLSPPLNMRESCFAVHSPYTVSKYAMSMLTLGMHQEFAGYAVSVSALWPRSIIATAAIEFALAGRELFERAGPSIMAEAAYHIMLGENVV